MATFWILATVVPSIKVVAAPSLDTTSTDFVIPSTQPQPGENESGFSSPTWPSPPSPFKSPYRPGPTITVSPTAAFVMPWPIDRHGLTLSPQVGPSTPTVATWTDAA